MNLSVLIHTFNDYRHLWQGSARAFDKHWNQRNIEVYWGTDYDPVCAGEHVGHMIYSGVSEWSDRLIKLVDQIPTDYLLYMQEDQWLTRSPPDISELMQIVTQNNILRFQISPVNDYYSLRQRDGIQFFKPKSKYLVSHQPSIWKKSFLLSCLKPGETPWVNEYEGTKRLNNDPQIIDKIAIYPFNWYDHKCVKGKVQS